jgi:dTDP-glucose 4,6-dehydratase
MKMAITGGAGFIGANFIYYILNNYPEHVVVCIDALTYAGNMETLESALANRRFVFHRADIADRMAIYEIFEEHRPDVVINFAAESHVDRSIENPELFLRTNILGTQVLLDACNKYGIKRFHQVSTDEVYGDLPLDRPDLLFTEKTPLQASSPYSASKAGADLLAQAYYRTYGTPVTISRCSNNYGPFQFPEKLIPLMITNAMENKPLPVYGKGENVRDWLYVEDHCTAIDLIIHKGRPGEVYNIGGNNERTNLEVVRTIVRILGRSENLITFVKDRPGHDLRYAIDASKIRKEMGWEPRTGFEEGLKRTIEWYISNQQWIEHVTSGEYQGYYARMYENI